MFGCGWQRRRVASPVVATPPKPASGDHPIGESLGSLADARARTLSLAPVREAAVVVLALLEHGVMPHPAILARLRRAIVASRWTTRATRARDYPGQIPPPR